MKKLMKRVLAAFLGKSLVLEYPWKPINRYGDSRLISPGLLDVLNSSEENFSFIVEDIISHKKIFHSISERAKPGTDVIAWKNDYFPGLDMVCLYTMMIRYNPSRVVEIGSGNSTLIMRKAIDNAHLQTKITSIDPAPRREIRSNADLHIASSLEDQNTDDLASLFTGLFPGDFVFMDGSHISLPNSDVTIFFNEIINSLPSGVIVQVHDVYLPYEYPDEMILRGYNEAYLLLQYLLGHLHQVEILFPSYYISRHKALSEKLEKKLWSEMPYRTIETHGGSFWFKIK